ncbi:hypothetical protein SSX86_023559 [Deinandra increscens subsp. villosa]|uniref:Protein kinase domain-containing protein n=1 Tax=Deinandra increscens subsp. villosa TaxID=3103831 RepID=A0AAP0CR98_9ASTR
MEKYEILEELGGGSYGVVWKAINKHTHETVAIKKLLTKYESPSAKMMINREVKSLEFNKHENIVTLKEIINRNNTIFLVFECMEGSLHDRMTARTKPFSETEIRDMCFQIFQGLAFMHRNGYIHRDLKPMNVLVSNNVVKISDLGSSREILLKDPRPYTHRVTTRWYRAPEVFLHSKVYDSAVDMWAMGAIMAELFTFQPLFKGSSDLRVMHKICSVLGSPTQSSWPKGHELYELARSMNYRFPDLPGVPFSEVLPFASGEAVNLIGSLLSWFPYARPTAMEALQHPFFHGCYRVPRNVCLNDADPSLPLVFKLAMVQEWMKKRSSLKRSCASATHNIHDDVIRLLPENPFEFMK